MCRIFFQKSSIIDADRLEPPGQIVAQEDGKIVSSCVCAIIPNLTHEQQPDAFMENAVADKAYRKRACSQISGLCKIIMWF